MMTRWTPARMSDLESLAQPSVAANRTCSRRARSAVVSPPSGYLMTLT